MKVNIVSKYDVRGGAAIAAMRLAKALICNHIEVSFITDISTSSESFIVCPAPKFNKIYSILKRKVSKMIMSLYSSNNKNLHSLNLFNSYYAAFLNNDNANIVHLHWINHEMISINDIAKIKKPIVWTLHDMWAFAGAEHYTEHKRWEVGYKKNNRAIDEKGIDINRWTWNRKLKKWKHQIHIVTPSRWLGECVKKSALMKHWPVSIIPNAIDTKSWKPLDIVFCRNKLSLPQDKRLILFGALGGGKDSRKGFDLLLSALKLLNIRDFDIELVILGQNETETKLECNFKANFLGHISDDISLQRVYGAVDLLVIPSRQDNLPNTGLEALSCGTPIVGFDVCGMPDIVIHKNTGYLAKPFDVADLADGVKWVLDPVNNGLLRKKSRIFAEKNFSFECVSKQYENLYKKILETDGYSS